MTFLSEDELVVMEQLAGKKKECDGNHRLQVYNIKTGLRLAETVSKLPIRT